jgi:hypothetical protein
VTLVVAEPDSHISSDFLINTPDPVVIGNGCLSAGMTNAAPIMQRWFPVAWHGTEITFRAFAASGADQNLFSGGGIHADHIIGSLTAGVTPEGIVHTLPTAEIFLHHGDDLFFTFSAASGARGHGGKKTFFCAEYRFICLDIIPANLFATYGAIQG